MDPIVVAVLVGLLIYILIIAIIPKRILNESVTKYTRNTLKQLESQSSLAAQVEIEQERPIFREPVVNDKLFTRAFFALPGSEYIYPSLVKGGLQDRVDRFFLFTLGVFIVALVIFRNMGALSVLMALVAAGVFAYWIINRAIGKRKKAILETFPDVLEMIVRSIRAGYPLNNVVRIVAENMQPPINEEFRQVADEMAHGSSMVDALKRMATRIGEPDIQFFVVVLSVQQEVGGNLAEVLTNLARLLRRRKSLRLRILALSAEGRATLWVLGSLPLLVALAVYNFTPSHFAPFFASTAGNILLASAVGIVLLGVFIVRKMVNIKV